MRKDVLFRNPILDSKLLAVEVVYYAGISSIAYVVFRYDPKDRDGPVNKDVYVIPLSEGAALAQIRKLHAREIEGHHSDSLPERLKRVAAGSYAP